MSRDRDLEPIISIETLNKYDADILFIVNLVKRSPGYYFQHPVFRSLKAVKNNRAYVVSHETWSGVGILGANNIFDDFV
ncbi:hypothetical protein [Chroogloeocystis siderophila]|uniref:hypothetical protein n=1 Tax=Chroogloeocystis siderophila TaxID=329163 RepID=UPI001160EF24|nr:hypothetical protein [Chroogloeocystis siderophila]